MRYHEVPDMWLNLGSDGPSPSRPVLSLGARWGKDAALVAVFQCFDP